MTSTTTQAKSPTFLISASLGISIVLTAACLWAFNGAIVGAAGGPEESFKGDSLHRRLLGFVHTLPPSPLTNIPAPGIAAPLPEPFHPQPVFIKPSVAPPATIPSPIPPALAVAVPIPPVAPPPPAPVPAQPVKDPDWDNVREANQASPPVAAIVIFNDYLNQHPETTHRQELQAFTESALDLIWWERISELCDQRKELTRKIQGATIPPAIRARAISRIQAIDKTLAGMGYSNPNAPDLSNLNQLAQLRQTRPAASYAIWKTSVLECIRRTRGLLPWEMR